MYELLRKVHLFTGLPDADLEHLSQATEEVRLSAKEDLFAEGSAGDRAYIVKEGQLEVLKVASGYEVSIALLDPGAIVDEMALLKETPRTTTVRARIDTLLLAIRKEHVDQLLRTSPSGAAIIHDVTARMGADEALADMASFAEMNLAPVLKLDQHGTILLVNPAARQLFGEPGLLGKSWYAICSELDPITLGKVLKRNDTLQCEIEVGNRCLLFTHRASVDRGQVYVYGADITEHKRAEDALLESEERIRLLLYSTGEAIYGVDLQGNCTFCNPACAWLVGYDDPEELLGQNMHDLIHHTRPNGEHYPQEECRIDQAFRDGEGTHVEDELLWCADGTSFPAEYRSFPIRRNDKVIGSVVTFVDITGRKLAEEALRESEERYRNIFDYSNDAIFIIDPALDQIVHANPKACDMLGYSQEGLLSVPVSSIHPGEMPVLRAFAQTVFERGHGWTNELTCTSKSLQILPVEISASTLEVRGKALMIAMVRDVTERKRVEKALRDGETMLRQNEKMAVLGTLTAGVAHELNNPAAAVKSGAGQLEAAASEFQQAQMRLSQLVLTAAQQGTLQRLTNQARLQAASPPELNALVRSDREDELKVLLETRGILDAWKHAPALVNLNIDTAGLGALADSFTPDQLPVIVDVLGATYEVYNVLTEIGQSAGRISEIVKALKAYSYLDQAPVQAVNVHEGLDNTLLVLGHKLKSGISVRKEYAPQLPNILANGNELNQVWTNLIDNAADALEGQGEVTIRTYQEGGWVVIEIEDNGPGIPLKIQSRIFEPFFTTKPSGLGIGLGLDISHNIVVQKHRGDINVLSEPGKTCFEVRLPITSPLVRAP